MSDETAAKPPEASAFDLMPMSGPALWIAGLLLALANFMAVLDITIANVSVPPELMKNIGFTEAQQAKFNVPDYAYMAQNASQLLDFWNKEFKA